jgi:hypothetical protein
MEFPEKSRSTTDKLFTWEEVRKLLDKETMRRAEYIARILIKLSEFYGGDVFTVAAHVIYQIGFEKGRARARFVEAEGSENNLENLAKLVSHETAKLYLGNEVEVKPDQLLVREDYCPLPRKWKEMGLPEDQIVSFCFLFDQVDKGMVEGYNREFEAHLSGCRDLAETGHCQMLVKRRD